MVVVIKFRSGSLKWNDFRMNCWNYQILRFMIMIRFSPFFSTLKSKQILFFWRKLTGNGSSTNHKVCSFSIKFLFEERNRQYAFNAHTASQQSIKRWKGNDVMRATTIWMHFELGMGKKEVFFLLSKHIFRCIRDTNKNMNRSVMDIMHCSYGF